MKGLRIEGHCWWQTEFQRIQWKGLGGWGEVVDEIRLAADLRIPVYGIMDDAGESDLRYEA